MTVQWGAAHTRQAVATGGCSVSHAFVHQARLMYCSTKASAPGEMRMERLSCLRMSRCTVTRIPWLPPTTHPRTCMRHTPRHHNVKSRRSHTHTHTHMPFLLSHVIRPCMVMTCTHDGVPYNATDCQRYHLMLYHTVPYHTSCNVTCQPASHK